MKLRRIHRGASASEPRTFQNRTGGPETGVPIFACKNIAKNKKYAALALAVSLWLAGGVLFAPKATATAVKVSTAGITPPEAASSDRIGTWEVSADGRMLTVGGTWPSVAGSRSLHLIPLSYRFPYTKSMQRRFFRRQKARNAAFFPLRGRYGERRRERGGFVLRNFG